MNKKSRSKRKNPFYVTESDLSKLRGALQSVKAFLNGRRFIEVLDEKLEDARVVLPEEVPVDEVEINRTVLFTDLDRKDQTVYKLVLPYSAGDGKRISVLTPLGSALLGSRVGDIVEVHAPARTRRVRVDGVMEGGNSVAA